MMEMSMDENVVHFSRDEILANRSLVSISRIGVSWPTWSFIVFSHVIFALYSNNRRLDLNSVASFQALFSRY